MTNRKNRRQVGTIKLFKNTVLRQSYETASWYTDVEIPAGEYPLFVNNMDFDDSRKCHWILAQLPGTVVKSFFVNRLFQYSSAEVDKDVGKPFTKGLQFDAFMLARYILEGFPECWQYEIKLNDEFAATYYGYDDDPYCGTAIVDKSKWNEEILTERKCELDV